MSEERRDNTIFVLGLLLAAALAFYGLYTEGNPTVIEIVEVVTNHVYKVLDPKIITRVDKQVIYMTATPGPNVDTIIYGTPIPQLAAKARADVVATLRALTPMVPTIAPSPTNTMVLPPPRSTMPPLPTVVPPPPTEVPPTLVPTEVPLPPTLVPTVPPPPPTLVPTEVPLPPTLVPTNTPVPPPPVPTNTPVPPTLVPPELAAPQPGNPEVAPTGGMATISGKIDALESDLTLILTNGDYFASVTIGDGNYVFENVPNGTYNLSVNRGGPGAGCGEIEVSVPEGHATLTYNYRFYKMQCALMP